MLRSFLIVLPIAVVLSGVSGDVSAESGYENFPQLIGGDGTKEICQLASAQRCINHVWSQIDADGDEHLTVEEIDSFIASVRRWNAFTDRSLKDRTVVKIALTTYRLAGTERLLSAYDDDNDGMLSKEEALSDLNLDQRPIAELLLDGDAFNAETLAARFGRLAPQLVRMAQTAGTSFGGRSEVTTAIAVKAIEDTDQVSETQ